LGELFFLFCAVLEVGLFFLPLVISAGQEAEGDIISFAEHVKRQVQMN
jgi:hypothetical protein